MKKYHTHEVVELDNGELLSLDVYYIVNDPDKSAGLPYFWPEIVDVDPDISEDVQDEIEDELYERVMFDMKNAPDRYDII